MFDKAASEKPPEDSLDDGPERTLSSGEPLGINPEELIQMSLDQAVQGSLSSPPGLVDARARRHGREAAQTRGQRRALVGSLLWMAEIAGADCPRVRPVLRGALSSCLDGRFPKRKQLPSH